MYATVVCHWRFFQKASKQEMENGTSKISLIYYMSPLSGGWRHYT